MRVLRVEEGFMSKIRVLSIDIETRPNLAYCWGLWDQNVHLKQIVESGEVYCFAARFLGERKVHFYSTFHDGKDVMVQKAWELLDEADVVLHYNGKRFDIPHLSREFVLAGLGPPSPYDQIDLLLAVRKQFKFPSNKLEYVAKALGFEGKAETGGFDLWVDCIAGDPKAWAKMKRYNIRDITVLEELYEKLLPWLPTHPNLRLYNAGGDDDCPRCGANGRLQKRGYRALSTGVYHQYCCQECGAFSRGTKRVTGTDVRAS
jgi:DNA polymerase elongation subunit (family B)